MRALSSCSSIVLVACGGGHVMPDAMDNAGSRHADANVVIQDAPVCAVPPGELDCAKTCGNGQLDDCLVAQYDTFHGMCRVHALDETCDGLLTCADIGLYGSVNVCEGCSRKPSVCEACNPANPECANLGFFRLAAMATSGSRLALIEPDSGAAPRIWILDGFVTVAQPSPTSRSVAIAGTAGGWLVATRSPSTIFSVSSSGAIGSAHPIETNAPNVDAIGLATAGSRTIVAWTEYAGAWTVTFEIVNASGQRVVAKTPLFTANGYTPAVGTDGTSFFVGSGGSLAKVRTNGTFSVMQGFPSGSRMQLTWGANTGWYLADPGTGYVAQQFDSSGAPVGSPIAIGSAQDFIADGADLLVLRYAGTKLNLVRINATGATLGTVEVGAGGASETYGGSVARVAEISGSVYVAWSWFSELHIAKIAAP